MNALGAFVPQARLGDDGPVGLGLVGPAGSVETLLELAASLPIKETAT